MAVESRCRSLGDPNGVQRNRDQAVHGLCPSRSVGGANPPRSGDAVRSGLCRWRPEFRKQRRIWCPAAATRRGYGHRITRAAGRTTKRSGREEPPMATTTGGDGRVGVQPRLDHSQPVHLSRIHSASAGSARHQDGRWPWHPQQRDTGPSSPRPPLWRSDPSVHGFQMSINRRRALGAAAAAAATVGIEARSLWPQHTVDYRRAQSRVAVLKAEAYSEGLEETVLGGLRLFRIDVRGMCVLLKPNLVEDLPGPVNTNSALIGVAARCFLRLGAAHIVIGEGPGHQRDTEIVVQAAGLNPHLSERQIEFVDLNRDELMKVKLRANYSGLGELWLPRSVLDADFIVSMPKVKTHHWAGVTLSLKNMFSIVPGMKYGWPKNLLHWSGIHESILDICATVPIHFVIADGITAMEGNGPLQGSSRQLGKIVLANDPVAADATCSRLMGVNPLRVRHLSEGCHFLGNLREDRIRMLAQGVGAPTRPFSVLPEFRYLVAAKS